MASKIVPILLAAGLALLMAGCAAPRHERFDTRSTSVSGEPGVKNNLAKLIYEAAQVLAERAVYLDKVRPIIVSTVVSVDDLDQSSTFGRLASQLIANRIVQRGYLVRDVTYMHAVALEPSTGELVLTREAPLSDVKRREARAQAVVAGTYAVGGKEIYLTLRLLSADTGELLSSADAVIPLDDNIEALLSRPTPPSPKISFDRFEELAQQGHIIK